MAKITDLKTDNIHQVRTCFYNGEIWTKNELAKQAGLSLAATTNTLQLLLKDGEIELVGEAKSTGGRKSKQYRINQDYYHIGTLTLKRDEQSYCFMIKVSDLLGNLLQKGHVVSHFGTIDEVMEVIDSLLKSDDKVAVLALSIPGVCKDGIIGICDFDELSNLALAKLIKERFGLEVVLENDVNVASIGFGKHYPNAMNLALMYQPRVKYIGCGFLVNHELCTGFSNFAGELSYLPFYTHQEQEQLLKNDPNRLLLEQLITICCVINPEIIAICSDVIEQFDDCEITKYLPLEHCPKIVDIKDLDELIFDGLCSLGIELLKNKIRKRES